MLLMIRIWTYATFILVLMETVIELAPLFWTIRKRFDDKSRCFIAGLENRVFISEAFVSYGLFCP